MKRLLSIFFVVCMGMSAQAQQLDFTNYYLNYGKHIHDFSSSEHGQLIEQVDLSKDNGIHYLNARNWQSGLYILDLIVNGKVVESKSIVVKH